MEVEVHDVHQRQRYEATVGGRGVGFAAYRPDGPITVFTHTEVDPSCEGQGIGAELVRQALDDVREHGGSVRPKCSFVAAFLDRHPDYANLRE
jgi:predicted GNAT family acetyltransferase